MRTPSSSPTVRQHLREAEIVARCAEQAVPATLERCRHIDRVGLHHVDSLVEAAEPLRKRVVERLTGSDEVRPAVHSCQPVTFAFRDGKRRIDHAQRFDQAFAEEIGERLPRNRLDHARGDIDADAVVPSRARLERKRIPREIVDCLGERNFRIYQLAVGVHAADRRILKKVVGQAAGVR